MKKYFALILTVFFFFMSDLAFSQVKKLPSYYKKDLNVDSIINHNEYGVIFYPEVKVYPPKIFNSKREEKQYEKLERNFKKVYPYALEMSITYRHVEDTLARLSSDKERKKYMKMREKQIMDHYKPKLVKLTISQSILLVKLLDRESGSTAYEIIDELKGGVKAFFWQSFAVMFGNNLKKGYDGYGNDKDIEELVQKYKDGYFD